MNYALFLMARCAVVVMLAGDMVTDRLEASMKAMASNSACAMQTDLPDEVVSLCDTLSAISPAQALREVVEQVKANS
ncbi:MAG: hypothetical protein OXF68_05700 [Gammaproteobacteria bacterium]|nr:hypothetical protein [Gammaproteobacteria bacterium]